MDGSAFGSAVQEVAEYLVRHEADINVRTNDGLTALDFAWCDEARNALLKA